MPPPPQAAGFRRPCCSEPAPGVEAVSWGWPVGREFQRQDAVIPAG